MRYDALLYLDCVVSPNPLVQVLFTTQEGGATLGVTVDNPCGPCKCGVVGDMGDDNGRCRVKVCLDGCFGLIPVYSPREENTYDLNYDFPS